MGGGAHARVHGGWGLLPLQQLRRSPELRRPLPPCQDALIRCVLAMSGDEGARELQRVRLLTSQVCPSVCGCSGLVVVVVCVCVRIGWDGCVWGGWGG